MIVKCFASKLFQAILLGFLCGCQQGSEATDNSSSPTTILEQGSELATGTDNDQIVTDSEFNDDQNTQTQTGGLEHNTEVTNGTPQADSTEINTTDTTSQNTDSRSPTSVIISAKGGLVQGTATDDIDVDRVEIAIINDSNKFWNGTIFTTDYTRVVVNLQTDGSWNYAITPKLPDGKYRVNAVAIDTSQNYQTPFSTYSFEEIDAPINDNDSDAQSNGTARIVGSNIYVAGEKKGIVIRYTAGSDGISVGGGISIGFHHASSFWVQTTNPADRHHFKVDVANEDNFAVKYYPQALVGMLTNDGSYNPDTIFHRVAVSKVINKAIPPNGVVDFHIGANNLGILIPVFTDKDHQFRVTTDTNGDGQYSGILVSPTINIVSDAANEISAVIPSQSVVGESIDVHIRVEDKHHNLASSFSDTVNVLNEQGQTVASNVLIVNGLAKTQLALTTTGPHRLRLLTSRTNLSGRSNPIRVFKTQQNRGIYWGDLHGHTGESDALGFDAEEFFAFGRDVAALDIIALTDHSTPNWPANVKAVQDFYDPGKYVTILGYETASRNNALDHMNVYFKGDSKTRAEVIGDSWALDYHSHLDQLIDLHNTNEPHAFTGPHHSGYERGARGDPNYPFEHWDNRIARFFEVYSSHGTSEFEGNPRPLRYPSTDPTKYMQGGLAMGVKFAVIGASDNHDSKPGRSAWGFYKGGLAGVWTTDLTRDSVWQSIWNYSTYGTSEDRIYVDFSINGEPMGSTINTDSPVNVRAYIIGKTDFLNAVLIKDNQEIKTFSTNNGLLEIDMTDSVSADGHFYYLRVTQDNGERAWSTPIWIE